MKKAFLKGLCSLLFFMVLLAMPVYAEEEGQTYHESIEDVDETVEGEVSGESGTEDEIDSGTGSEETVYIKELSGFQITFKQGNSYVYTGNALTPVIEKVVFTDQNGQTVETTALTSVEYKNNVNIGNASVEISIEGYEGTVEIENAFQIVLGSAKTLKATPVAYNKTKLSWSKVAGADGYVLYRRTSNTNSFKTLKVIKNGATVSYNDTSVKIGTTYYYKMRAYRMVDGKKVYSAYTNIIKQKAQVATAKMTSAKRASYNSIKLTWGKVSGASGYGIYRSTSEKGTYTRIGTVKGGSNLTYTDTKCSCGVTYYYKVAAYRTSGVKNYYGSKSSSISAKTTPRKVSFTTDTMSGEIQATLSWEKSSGATGYTIYRSTSKNAGYKAVKHIKKATTLKWKNTGLKEEQVYYYKVRPYVLRNGEKIYGAYSGIYKKELLSVKIKNVRKYTYVPYRSGGTTPRGWDCSGFTQWATRYLLGVEIENYSGSQAVGGKAVSKTKRSTWKPGDILVYSCGGRVNHVALYLGNNEIMHALNTKYDTVIQDVDYYEKWDKRNNLKCVRRYF